MRRHFSLFGALALLGSATGLFVLRELPYSSVRIAGVDSDELRRPPNPDFTVGPLTWRVSALRQDAALRPFRDAMHATCGEQRGLAAAACATRVLRNRVPPGDPSSEYVDRAFDPVAVFDRHMAGEPGHCLTRSAILATELLSVGVPARVFQMVPPDDRGHTLVEVWDDSLGWVVVDASSNGYLVARGGSAPAVDLLENRESLDFRGFGPDAPSASEAEEMHRYFEQLLTGNLLYPEPWLYLRLGARVGPWPTRGQYVRAGPAQFALGPVQHALVVAIPVLGLLGVALVLAGWRRPDTLRTPAWSEPQRSPARAVDDLDALPPG